MLSVAHLPHARGDIRGVRVSFATASVAAVKRIKEQPERLTIDPSPGPLVRRLDQIVDVAHPAPLA
jgi:hypothetical protein